MAGHGVEESYFEFPRVEYVIYKAGAIPKFPHPDFQASGGNCTEGRVEHEPATVSVTLFNVGLNRQLIQQSK